MDTITTRLSGRAWCFDRDLPSDGGVLPLRFAIQRIADGEELRHHLFEGVRPGIAERLNPGDILVVNGHFGTGKLHVQPFLALRAAGVGVVARSLPHLAVRRLVAEGIPAATLPGEQLSTIEDGDRLTVDFASGDIENHTRGGRIAAVPFDRFLVDIVRHGGLEGSVRAELRRRDR
ncbi:hypothetical protein [Streptosporangium sp. NPDC006930]|uniref:hypothetical protein n=1 Tax=unclassified Streptosporangium TaxID=2632669 RepID=UPI003432895F